MLELYSGHIAKGCFGKFLRDIIWHSTRTDSCMLNCDLVPIGKYCATCLNFPDYSVHFIRSCYNAEDCSYVFKFYLLSRYGVWMKTYLFCARMQMFSQFTAQRLCDSSYRKWQESIIQKVRNNYHSILFKT